MRLSEINADDDAYHAQMRQRTASARTREELRAEDADTARALLFSLRAFMVGMMHDTGVFLYVGSSVRDGLVLPEVSAQITSDQIAARIVHGKRNRKIRQTCALLSEMMPALRAAEERLREVS